MAKFDYKMDMTEVCKYVHETTDRLKKQIARRVMKAKWTGRMGWRYKK